MNTNDRVKTIEAHKASLRNARANLLTRTDDVSSAFEAAINLNRAALNLMILDEFSEEDSAALNEILMLSADILQAGYCRYLLKA